MKSLLYSRKFWLTVWALLQTVAAHYLNIPQDVWVAMDAVILALIASIALEDAAAKASGKGQPPAVQ